jgi:hypothetical protein
VIGRPTPDANLAAISLKSPPLEKRVRSSVHELMLGICAKAIPPARANTIKSLNCIVVEGLDAVKFSPFYRGETQQHKSAWG